LINNRRVWKATITIVLDGAEADTEGGGVTYLICTVQQSGGRPDIWPMGGWPPGLATNQPAAPLMSPINLGPNYRLQQQQQQLLMWLQRRCFGRLLV